MAKVQLCNITVMDNPSPFLNPFQFEITFECIEELKEGKYYWICSITYVCDVFFCRRSGMEDDLRRFCRERGVRSGIGFRLRRPHTGRKAHVRVSGTEGSSHCRKC